MKELKELYNTYYPQLYAYCLTLTRSKPDAEDLTAETFYRAITHIGQFRGDSKLSVWLCSIARNTFLSEQKKRKRRYAADPPPDPAFSWEEKESATEILICLNGLDEPYRGVFLLRTVGGTEYAEIAKIYQKSECWTRVTYYRARMKIIEKLEERHE